MEKTGILILFLLLFTSSVSAQIGKDPSREGDRGPSSIEETLTRSKIDLAEKNHQRAISSAEEINSLSKELLKSIRDHNQFSSDDQKKLNKIEKLAKQVRSEQGGGGGDEESAPPENLTVAMERLHQTAEEIEKESIQLSRHTVSAALVIHLNEVLTLTKVIKKLQSK